MMRPMVLPPARRALAVLCAVSLFLLAGCASAGDSGSGGSGSGDPGTSGEATATPAAGGGAALPEDVRESGVLRVGSQQTYVPAEFREEGASEVTGFSVDLLEELTSRLGLELEWVQADYSALIPGLEAGRFDMGSGGMSPNPERLEVIDMVGYYQSGATFITRKEDEGKYATATDFCGETVGVIQGSSTLEAAIEIENGKCAAEGEDPIKLQGFNTTPNGLQQLSLGRISAYLPDYAQSLYLIEERGGDYALIAEDYYLVKYLINWTFPKDADPALMDAVATTLGEMMADGTYDSILEEWGVQAGAIDAPVINNDPEGDDTEGTG